MWFQIAGVNCICNLLLGALITAPGGVAAFFVDSEHSFNMSEYYRMPPLYEMDDYDRCFEENPPLDGKIVYCYARSQIQPNETIEVWEVIKNFSADTKRHFRHDRLGRGVCLHWCYPHFRNFVPSAKRRFQVAQFDNGSEVPYSAYSIEAGMDDRIKYDKWTSMCINWNLKKTYNLKAHSRVEYCLTNEKGTRYPIDSLDRTFVLVCIGLAGLLVMSTAFDHHLKGRAILNPNESCHYRSQVTGPYSSIAVSFSLPRNWYRLMAKSTTEHSQDLRPVHALRFLTMFCVILGHCVLIMNSMPTSNPQYMERNFYRIITQLLINGPTVIQTFFVITGYMLSTQFMKLRANTSFKWRYMWHAILHRYLRLTPVYMFCVLFDSTWLVRMQNGPLWLHTVGPKQQYCRQHWWTNLLYVNNMVETSEPCFQHGWYLAADFQLFLVGVMMHMVFWRFPGTTKYLLSLAMFASYAIPGIITYANHFEGIFMATPESQRYLQWYDAMYRLVYIPAYTNSGSFLCGIIGGIAYGTWKQERRVLTKNDWLRTLFWASFPVCLMLLLSGYVFFTYDMPRPSVWMSMYAAVQKNVWGLFVAAMITAMAFGIGWIIKDLLCHPVFRPLGRLTFCAYLVHPTIIHILLGDAHQPVYLSDNLVVMHTLSVLVISYEVALVLAICVEFPITYLLQHFSAEPSRPHELPRLQGTMLELDNRK